MLLVISAPRLPAFCQLCIMMLFCTTVALLAVDVSDGQASKCIYCVS